MTERIERSKEIISQLKKTPQVELDISKAIYPILKEYNITVNDDELLIFRPIVVIKPEIIFERPWPCMFGICPEPWIHLKEKLNKIFSFERFQKEGEEILKKIGM